MKQRAYGFTIVELLIVIVVIGILAMISTVGYSSIQTRTKEAHLSSDINAIKKAMQMFRAERGDYPICPGGSSECQFMPGISQQLMPEYISGLNTYSFAYVKSGDRWGMRYLRNNQPYNLDMTCKFGVDMVSTWYASAPECK